MVHTAVNRIDARTCNERCLETDVRFFDSPDTQSHVMQDCEKILPAVGKVREPHPRVPEATQALEETPDSRKSGEESH
jgi:hypothetical protein